MAKTRDIRTRVAFEGETEYKKVVSDIAAEHKKLNNELKAAQAEFKATGNAEKMFEEKSKLLNKQIEAQNKAIKTAEDALKKLKDNGVDKSSAAWVYWEKELTSAKTAMFNATAELNKLNSEFGNVTSATERATQETADYSGTLKSIDKGVKFQNVLKGLGLIKEAVGAVISTAFRMGKALVMSQVSGGDWAREIMMGAAAADLSVEEYQARQYAQALSGIEYGPIDESIQELRKRLNSTGEDAVTLYKGMNELGIASRETELQALDAAKAFWDIVNALDEIENADTRNTLAERIFGDKYMSIRSLLNYGGEEYLKLIEEGREAATVTEESVNALADMDAAYEKTSATAQSLMHNINAELAPGFTEMADAFGSILQDFNEFITSEEGKNVIAGWNEDLSTLAGIVKDTDFTGAFETIASALKGVRETIEWIINNYNGIRNTVGVLAPVLSGSPLWASGKVNKTVADAVSSQGVTPSTGTNIIGSMVPEATVQATQSKDLQKYAEELKNIHSGITSAYIKNDYEKIYKDVLGILQNENYKPFLEDHNIRQGLSSFLDIYESGNAMTDGYLIYGAMKNLMAHVDSIMSQTAEVAETGGGGAMNAFNAAIEKGTQDTQKTLKTGVAAAFSGFDSLFASMGTAHGSAYINALSAQMARINSMLYASPSYAYGGTYYNPAQGAYASPTSTANVSLYVGREKFGDVTTPIVDARLGAAIETAR